MGWERENRLAVLRAFASLLFIDGCGARTTTMAESSAAHEHPIASPHPGPLPSDGRGRIVWQCFGPSRLCCLSICCLRRRRLLRLWSGGLSKLGQIAHEVAELVSCKQVGQAG